MRIRTAKKVAQRIDLQYFKRARGIRRWRLVLSGVAPLAALLWIAGAAAAGNRRPYSAGPVAPAHAFAEQKCEVCHSAPDRAEHAPAGFRRHATETACLTCHAAPPHAANQKTPPACAAGHQEHRGRIALARTADRFCLECHGTLQASHGPSALAAAVGPFPDGHPEFAAVRAGAPPDPGRVRFNHAVHLKDTVRGPNGPERLECPTCHVPDVSRAAAHRSKPASSGLMAPVSYRQQCARCHPLFFDERISYAAPHDTPEKVRAFVQQALLDYIGHHPDEISTPDTAFRRVPLNFRRPIDAPAPSSGEWAARRGRADERILWNTCAGCHEGRGIDQMGRPVFEKTNIAKQWMPRASFDHNAHGMLKCTGCHAAEASTQTSDVLLPPRAACAACHARSTGAESRCFECHLYHDWTKAHRVQPAYSPADFK